MVVHVRSLPPVMIPMAVHGIVGVGVVVGMVICVVICVMVCVMVRVMVVVVMRGPVVGSMVTEAVVVIVMVSAGAPAEALAQRELGRQLPYGLPLVENGLFLPDQALAQVENGAFGLVRNYAAHMVSITMSVTVTVAMAAVAVARTMPRTVAVPWGKTRRVRVCGDGGADEFGVRAIIILQTRQATRSL